MRHRPWEEPQGAGAGWDGKVRVGRRFEVFEALSVLLPSAPEDEMAGAGRCVLGRRCAGTDKVHPGPVRRLVDVQEVEVFEKIASRFEANHPELPDLQSIQRDMVSQGNEAASDYPDLDRIVRAEII